MAEEGLLVNFAAPEVMLPARAKVAGGNWRTRRVESARRKYHQSKDIQDYRKTFGAPDGTIEARAPVSQATASSTAKYQPPRADNVRPTKRRRLDVSSESAMSDGKSTIRAKRQKDPSHQVVSSLFTSNPKPTSTPNKAVEESEYTAPSNAPLPEGAADFTGLGLSQRLSVHLVTKSDLKRPTAIQLDAVPELIKHNTDAFIQAETGSGKTLAYLLPILQRLQSYFQHLKEKQALDNGMPLSRSRGSGLFAIILAPTRELCKQIYTVLDGLLHALPWIVASTVAGGEKKKSEKARVRKGLNILVATPGRLVDHLQNTETLDVSLVKFLVLDEADSLAELGFEKDIQEIVDSLDRRARRYALPELPERRINILCSATLKGGAQRLGEISLKDAAHFVGPTGTSPPQADPKAPNSEQEARTFMAPAQLQQSYSVVPAKLRFVSLVAHLRSLLSRQQQDFKAIVFLSCADAVDFHFSLLSRFVLQSAEGGNDTAPRDGDPRPAVDSTAIASHCVALQTAASPLVTIFCLHGSLPQATRTSTLQSYRSCAEPGIMFCTDLASRGLDLPSITAVLEYDPAFDPESHVHRVGRTARAGNVGQAAVFLQPGCEEKYIDRLQSMTQSPLQAADNTELLRRAFKPSESSSTPSKHAWEEVAANFQLDVERWIADPQHTERITLARRAYISSVRAYATHTREQRDAFNVKQLHLGHLAKAFGLRDRPGEMTLPGARASGRAKRKKGGKDEVMRGKHREGQSGVGFDTADAAQKMRQAIRGQNAVSEFNIA